MIAPPAAPPPSGRRARARARWAGLWIRGLACDRGVSLGRGVRFELAPGARVTLRRGSAVGARTRIDARGSVIVEAGAVLGERCVISALEQIWIGPRALLADEVVLLDHEPVADDVERPIREQGERSGAIRVGEAARIGPRAVLCRGASVPAAGEVASQSVVTYNRTL
ncbi:MAG: hypothetical protein NVS1B9_04780 [Solirubrobacteraceae bacterium]